MTRQAKQIGSNRIIGHLKGSTNGPTLVFFGGIHGNEPSGVEAIQEVFLRIEKEKLSLNGNIYGIRGNVKALLAKKRFLDHDLNRLWTIDNIEKLKTRSEEELFNEDKEFCLLYTSPSPRDRG